MAEPKKARLEDEGGQQNGAEEGGDDRDAPEYDEKLLKDIEKLQEVQDELERVNEEASDKVLEVEQKYNEVRRPVYNRRNDIIAGISDFWLTAFLSHPALSQVLSEDDQKVFKYLKELNVEDFKDVKSGYTISFTFKPNPFFKDETLRKTFRFSEDGLVTVTGTKPRWNEGMDLVNEGSVKDEHGRKRARSEDSFFRWFNDSDATYDPSQDQDQIAEVIKDELWPNPLKYFNSDQYDEDDDEEDEGEEDLEEELEELEEEEEEEGEEGEEGEEEEEEEEEEGGEGEEEEGAEGEEEEGEEGEEEEGGEEGEGDEEGNEEGAEEEEGEDEEGE